MKKPSEVFKNIRFAKLDPKHDKGPKGSTDDEEHGAVSEVEWDQQLKHVKKRAMQEKVDKPTGELKDACWKGYTAVGMKMKDGKKVPNCVPTNEGADMKAIRMIKDIYKRRNVKEEVEQVEEATTQQQKSDHDKWKEEYQKARKSGSSSSNAKARANGAVYEEEQLGEGAFKRIATDKEEDERLKSKSWRKETPWMKVKNIVTDKSGAKHGPMSRARDLARKAAIVKEAADKAKSKKKEKKESDDTFQANPELSTQVIRND